MRPERRVMQTVDVKLPGHTFQGPAHIVARGSAALQELEVVLLQIRTETLSQPRGSQSSQRRRSASSYLGQNFPLLTLNLPRRTVAFIGQQQDGHVVGGRLLRAHTVPAISGETGSPLQRRRRSNTTWMQLAQ